MALDKDKKKVIIVNMETQKEVVENEVLKFGERKDKDKPLVNMVGVRLNDDQLKAINSVAWRFHRDKAEVVRDCIDMALPALQEAYMKIARKKLNSK